MNQIYIDDTLKKMSSLTLIVKVVVIIDRVVKILTKIINKKNRLKRVPFASIFLTRLVRKL